jgi:hypothetical protein
MPEASMRRESVLDILMAALLAAEVKAASSMGATTSAADEATVTALVEEETTPLRRLRFLRRSAGFSNSSRSKAFAASTIMMLRSP